MRLWSIHPKYLDTAGLVALWRETLLARKVLENKTNGYKNHPQLFRFKKKRNPISTINSYLIEIYEESLKRGFQFNKNKLGDISKKSTIIVTKGQIKYEFKHLLQKLEHRDIEKYKLLKDIKKIDINPIFELIDGKIEYWEKINL